MTQERNEALDKIAAELEAPSAQLAGIEGFCDRYRAIRKYLEAALEFIAKIPVYGKTIAAIIRLLMGIADIACPVRP